MRIVITGASGNVGTALLLRLGASGTHQLVGISRRPPPHAPPYSWAHWECLDIGEDDAPARLRTTFANADAVVHLAWLIQPSHERELMRRTNVRGTAAVVDAALDVGVRHLVHQSSIGAYSPGPGKTVDESWPTDGVATSTYSVDKAAAERIVSTAERACVVTRVRPALIMQDAAASEITRYFLGPLVPHALLRPSVIRFAPLPDALAFQLVHADDVAAAIELLLTTGAGGAFNVAASPIIDRAVFRSVFGGVGPALPPSVLRATANLTWHARLQPTEPGWIDLAAQVPKLDSGRLAGLGWRPAHPATDVLGRFIDALARGAGRPGPLLRPRQRADRVRRRGPAAGDSES
jgi:nucleoside-diphosphate-sugar epimerase